MAAFNQIFLAVIIAIIIALVERGWRMVRGFQKSTQSPLRDVQNQAHVRILSDSSKLEAIGKNHRLLVILFVLIWAAIGIVINGRWSINPSLFVDEAFITGFEGFFTGIAVVIPVIIAFAPTPSSITLGMCLSRNMAKRLIVSGVVFIGLLYFVFTNYMPLRPIIAAQFIIPGIFGLVAASILLGISITAQCW